MRRSQAVRFFVCALVLLLQGCSRDRLIVVGGRVDQAHDRLKKLVQKNEDDSKARERRILEMGAQLEEQASKTQRQQEAALENLGGLQNKLTDGKQPTDVVLPQAPVEPAPVPTDATSTVAPTPAPVQPTASQPDPRFQAAYADYSRGAYDLAIKGFEMLRESFLEGKERGRIEYLIGECYYGKEEYTNAVQSLTDVSKYTSDATLAAPATWKRALCYERLRLPARRTEMLQELVQKYPDSEEAVLAREWLEGGTPP